MSDCDSGIFKNVQAPTFFDFQIGEDSAASSSWFERQGDSSPNMLQPVALYVSEDSQDDSSVTTNGAKVSESVEPQPPWWLQSLQMQSPKRSQTQLANRAMSKLASFNCTELAEQGSSESSLTPIPPNWISFLSEDSSEEALPTTTINLQKQQLGHSASYHYISLESSAAESHDDAPSIPNSASKVLLSPAAPSVPSSASKVLVDSANAPSLPNSASKVLVQGIAAPSIPNSASKELVQGAQQQLDAPAIPDSATKAVFRLPQTPQASLPPTPQSDSPPVLPLPLMMKPSLPTTPSMQQSHSASPEQRSDPALWDDVCARHLEKFGEVVTTPAAESKSGATTQTPSTDQSGDFMSVNVAGEPVTQVRKVTGLKLLPQPYFSKLDTPLCSEESPVSKKDVVKPPPKPSTLPPRLAGAKEDRETTTGGAEAEVAAQYDRLVLQELVRRRQSSGVTPKKPAPIPQVNSHPRRAHAAATTPTTVLHVLQKDPPSSRRKPFWSTEAVGEQQTSGTSNRRTSVPFDERGRTRSRDLPSSSRSRSRSLSRTRSRMKKQDQSRALNKENRASFSVNRKLSRGSGLYPRERERNDENKAPEPQKIGEARLLSVGRVKGKSVLNLKSRYNPKKLREVDLGDIEIETLL